MTTDLKIYRLTHGLTQHQAAVALGLTKSSISMIENGHRQLPFHAREKLLALQAGHGATAQMLIDMAQQEVIADLKNKHLVNSAEYINEHCGNLKYELHRHSKQLKNWTKKLDDAATELDSNRLTLEAAEQSGGNEKWINELRMQKLALRKQIEDVLMQKPELAIIRIEGIKKELAAAKKMLAQRDRFSLIKVIAPALLLPGHKTGELKEKNKQIKR